MTRNALRVHIEAPAEDIIDAPVMSGSEAPDVVYKFHRSDIAAWQRRRPVTPSIARPPMG